MSWSSAGSRSRGCEIGLSVIGISGSSKTVSLRSVSCTLYGETQPFSTTIPSTNSTAMPGGSESSSVTTPSSPTRSSARHRVADDRVLLGGGGRRCGAAPPPPPRAAPCRSSSTRTAVASSIPRRRSMGFAPSSSASMPSCTIDRASGVAVVVPSPVTSPVLLATLRTSCARLFVYWPVSSISRAIETPSFAVVGAPASRSSTTLRPVGPSATLTVLASSSTPAWSRRRACRRSRGACPRRLSPTCPTGGGCRAPAAGLRPGRPSRR